MLLYVVGPAFDCPSVDPQSNAAVALLQTWQQRTGGSWDLVCANTDFDRLPLLEVADGRRLSGYRQIARYLESETARGSAAPQHSHISIEAFVESHGQTLIDIAYYVSYENYTARTRPALTSILPWYANYILPPQRRATARDRTRHLGISGIDMDDVHESVLDDKPASESMSLAERRFNETDTTSRRARTLLGRKPTVRGMLRLSEHSGAFKLKNLADNFYEPLQAMLADLDVSSPAGCFVYGYLSLLANTQLPQPWAAEIMNTHYQQLATFVHNFPLKNSEVTWSSTQNVALSAKLSFCANALVQQLPFLPHAKAVAFAPSKRGQTTRTYDYVPQMVLSSVISVVLGGWYAHRLGFWPRGEQVQIFLAPRRVSDYGAADSVLSVLKGL